MIEPRTTVQMMADLLQFAVEADAEWSGRVNTECHCHPVYAHCCPSCQVF